MLLVVAAVRISEDSSDLIEFMCHLLLHCDASCDEDAYLSRRKKTIISIQVHSTVPL